MLSICGILMEMMISVFTDVGLGFFDLFLGLVVSDSGVLCWNNDVIFCWR